MKTSLIIMLTAFCFAAFSCEKRHLCSLPHPHETEINVVYDWQHLFPNTDIPSSMLLYAYRENIDDYFVFTVKSSSDMIKLPLGEYKILTIDGDIQRAQLLNMEKIESASAFTPLLYSNTHLYTLYPEMLHSTCTSISVTSTAPSTIKLIPTALTHHISIIAKTQDTDEITVQNVQISGLSASINILSGIHSREQTGTHIFVMSKTAPSTFSGDTFTMGICPDIKGRKRISNILTLSITENVSKASYSVSTDVSDIANTIKGHQLTIYTEVTGSAQIGFDIAVTGFKTGYDDVLIVKTQPKK